MGKWGLFAAPYMPFVTTQLVLKVLELLIIGLTES